MAHKGQKLKRKEIVKHGTIGSGIDEFKIIYTNIDEIIPRKLELTDYLKEKEPDVVCLVETKLMEDIQIKIEENDYNTWRENRMGKKVGGVIIMSKSRMSDKSGV